jgi:leader peptidase (prepilin peptidase) / N-methyltransferase
MMPFILTVLGLLFGSFANVCIWRIPRGEEVVRTPSHCPACGAPIRWYDNIPLLSYILLLGRCRSCRAGIPWRYPLVESVSGALFLLLYLRFGPDWRLAGYIPLAWALLVISAIDIEHYIIPDPFTYGGIAAGLAFAGAAVLFAPLTLSVLGPGPAWRWSPLLDGAAGAAAGGGLIALVAWFGRLWYRQEAMGGGDVKLAAMIGAFLGWKGVLLAIFLGMLTGTVAGLALLALGKTRDTGELNRTVFAGEHPGAPTEEPVEPKAAVPFGPFLAAGALSAVFFGPALASWYAGLFP